MMSLGTALMQMEQHDEAHQYFDRALALVTRRYGENHLETARVKIEVATKMLGSDQAVDLLRQALDIDRARLGPKHPEVARTMRKLANELHLKGQYDEAERTYLEALELSREIYGPNHPDVLLIVENLRFLYHRTSQVQKILPLARAYVDAAQATFGSKSLKYADYLCSLGMDIGDFENADEGFAMVQSALDIMKSIDRDKSQQGAECRGYLARVCLRRGEYDQAESLARETITIYEQNSSLPGGTVRAEVAQGVLGEVATARGQWSRAEPVLLSSYEALAPMRSSPKLRAAAINRLVKLYESWDAAEPNTGKAELAALWRNKLDPKDQVGADQ